MRSARVRELLVGLMLATAACDRPQAEVLRKLPITARLPSLPARAASAPKRRCPLEMVDVRGRFCIDRYEATLVESSSGRPVSPYYHPSRKLALRDFKDWAQQALRVGPQSARKLALPELPAWQRERDFPVRARVEQGRIPNAYLDLETARQACTNAGKRLCTHDEWVTACRSEHGTRHPYGDHFVPGRCNVGRLHPAAALHGKLWLGPLDPRMNLVRDGRQSLLRETGGSPECASAWGDDRIFDMVGNLDEWIDDPSGVFLGGFYARETTFGCDDRIEIHSADYYDYTLGMRCCR